MSTLLQQFNAGLGDVVARGWDSLVRVSDGIGAGAGTIWHAEGLIVTNAHVVLRREMSWGRRPRLTVSEGLRVTLKDGREFSAKLIAQDVEGDLAALAVEASELPTIEVGTSAALRAGQWVTALGHPWGVHGAATSGVVIAAGKDLPEMPPEREWIALGLHLRPGHSGGPLLDSGGRLVGINTMITGPDVGFAIPVDRVKAFLKETIGSAAEPV